jgi:hypothetical protein
MINKQVKMRRVFEDGKVLLEETRSDFPYICYYVISEEEYAYVKNLKDFSSLIRRIINNTIGRN